MYNRCKTAIAERVHGVGVISWRLGKKLTWRRRYDETFRQLGESTLRLWWGGVGGVVRRESALDF